MEENNSQISELPQAQQPIPVIIPKKSFFSPFVLILAFFAVAILAGGVGYTLSSKAHQPTEQNTNLENITPTISKNPIIEADPELAYLDIDGIAALNYASSDLGGIFLVNPADSTRTLLYKFDRADLQNVSNELLYSPKTQELLVNTRSGIVAINIHTNQLRTLYTAPTGQTVNFTLSADTQSLYVTTSTGYTYGSPLGQSSNYTVSLINASAQPQTVTTPPVDKEPYFDPTSGKSVVIKVKDSVTQGAGMFISSTDINVTDTKTGATKSYLYNKPGEVEPLFAANNYFYFKVDQCCAAGSGLNSMMQLNLQTGEVSNPASLPLIQQKLTQKLPLEDRSISPDGKHYVYYQLCMSQTCTTDSEAKTYIYNITTNQETELNLGINQGVIWSLDSTFALFNKNSSSNPSGQSYLYNVDSKKVEQINSPSNGPYVILR